MKRIIGIFLILSISLVCFSQTQKGFVRTPGRENKSSEEIPNVLIRLVGGHNDEKSGDDGTFTLALGNSVNEVLYKKNQDAYREKLLQVRHNLGIAYYEQKKYKESESFLCQALTDLELLYMRLPKVYSVQLSNMYSSHGNLYKLMHRYSDCEKYYQLAYNIREQLFELENDTYRKDFADAQFNLGTLYFIKQDYNKCEKYLLSAIDNYNSLSVNYSDAYRPFLAKAQDNLVDLYCDTKEYKKGIKFSLEALTNFEILFKQNPSMYNKRYVETLHRLGSLYYILKDYKTAEKYFLLALENENKLFNQNEYLEERASTQYNLGFLYFDTQDFYNGEKFFLSTLSIRESLYNEEPNKFRDILAATYWKVMLLYEAKSERDQYELYLNKALKLYKVLYNQNASYYQSAIIQLNSSLVRMLLLDSKIEEAFTLAIETYEIDKNDPISRYYLAQAYNMKAYSFAQSNNFDESIKSIDRAIEIISDDANLYDSKGEILLMQGKDQEALEMWKKVLELNPDFLKDYPEGTNLSNGLKTRGLIE